MIIRSAVLREIIRDEVRHVISENLAPKKVKSDIEIAIDNVKADTESLRDLVAGGKVNVKIGNSNIELKVDNPPLSRLKSASSSDQLVKDLSDDIQNLNVTVRTPFFKKTLTGNIAKPFKPKGSGFGFGIKLHGNF
tara:strand:- start:115 stop:522 length:408 start_codon:yes stop_codon:yes gene_type:complete